MAVRRPATSSQARTMACHGGGGPYENGSPPPSGVRRCAAPPPWPVRHWAVLEWGSDDDTRGAADNGKVPHCAAGNVEVIPRRRRWRRGWGRHRRWSACFPAALTMMGKAVGGATAAEGPSVSQRRGGLATGERSNGTAVGRNRKAGRDGFRGWACSSGLKPKVSSSAS